MNLDAAVNATLEMESYLTPKPAILGIASTDVECPTDKTSSLSASATTTDTDPTACLMKQLIEQMDRMKLELWHSKRPHSTTEGRGSQKGGALIT